MRLLFMVYLVLIYALVYALGEFVSGRIGLPHSVTFAGLAVFLAAYELTVLCYAAKIRKTPLKSIMQED